MLVSGAVGDSSHALVDYLAIIVPVLWVPIGLGVLDSVAKETTEIIWQALAAALAAAALAKITFQVDSRAADHARLLDKNSQVAHDARGMADSPPASADELARLGRQARELNDEDAMVLQEPSLRLRQYAYRRAVKDMADDAANARCGQCGTSVYDYRRGDCSMCGNKTRS